MQHLQPNTTLQGGKYRIERVLGQGGFGITYLAVQTALQRKVAIKEFFMKDFCGRDEVSLSMLVPSAAGGSQVEQYKKKFIKEANNLKRLNHPNIIKVLDVFEENGTVYYSMPYLSGGSLSDYVKAHGVLSETEAMKYVRQIASALKYMHTQMHICHYDVKPANILLDDKGNAVLIDFGISKNYDSAGHQTSTTPIGLSEGYAPIEQYQQNVDEFSPASDVYALGATLYFLLHGKRPVSAVHRVSGIPLLMSKHLSQRVKDIINSSMKISKRDRAQSMDVFMGNVYTSIYGDHTSVQDDESTIIDGKQRTEKVNTTYTQSHTASPTCHTSSTQKGNNSTIGWIIGIAAAVIIGFFIYNNQGVKDNSINVESPSNHVITTPSITKQSQETTKDSYDTESVEDEETVRKQKEQAIKDSYISIIDIHSSKDEDDEWWSPCYFLYDITNDGIPELWLMIKDRTVNTIDASLLVYTYTEKGVKSLFNGSFGHPYHNYLCKGNGYILKVFAHMGEACWSKYTYKNGAITEQVVFTEELNGPQEDYTEPSESEVNTIELTNRTPINNIHIKK